MIPKYKISDFKNTNPRAFTQRER